VKVSQKVLREMVTDRIVHGTYLSIPSHRMLCISHPTRFPL